MCMLIDRTRIFEIVQELEVAKNINLIKHTLMN